MKRPSRSALLRLGISAGLLILLFAFVVDPAAVGEQLRAAADHPLALATAFLLYCVLGSLVRGFRWRALILGLGQPIRLGRATELFLVGTYFNQFLPTGIGGDLVRALALAQDGMGRARAASTVIVDRALGLLPLFALGLAALAVARDRATPAVALTLGLAGLAGTLGLLALMRIDRWIRFAARLPLLGRLLQHGGIVRFVGSFRDYAPGSLGRGSAWGFVFALLLVGSNAALGRAVDITQLGLLDWAIFVPLVALTTLLPSIGGWGVRELLYVGLLGAVDPPVSEAQATALSILFGGLNLILAACGGLLVGMGRASGLPQEAEAGSGGPESESADQRPPEVLGGTERR